jgi:hypothetical protein
MWKFRTTPTPGHFIDLLMRARQTLPQRTNFQNFILFDQFQIALPLNGNGIILRARLALTRWTPAMTQQ